MQPTFLFADEEHASESRFNALLFLSLSRDARTNLSTTQTTDSIHEKLLELSRKKKY